MKDFASALAHDMFYNDFDNMRAEDRVLVIDSGRGEMQSLMSSLDGTPGSEEVEETMEYHSIRTASTAGASSELIAVASREREVAKHGELEQLLGIEKDHSEARGKRKRCSISTCAKKSRWQCKVCGAAVCHDGDCIAKHQGIVREDMKVHE